MELDKLTIGEAKQLAALFCGGDAKSKRLPVAIGEKLFIWTITAHFTGQVTAVSEEEIELKDAAWVADDGRVADSAKSGDFKEIEPFPNGETIVLHRATFLMTRVLKTELPRSQK